MAPTTCSDAAESARELTTTATPSAANRSAVARPIPRELPVTTATRFSVPDPMTTHSVHMTNSRGYQLKWLKTWTVKYSSIMGRSPQDPELADTLLELCCHVEGIRATASRVLGLTPQQTQLLTSVAPGELSHGELASRLHCDKTNVTGLVDRLERRNLVQRHPDPADRRVTQVSLTDSGTELVDRFRATLTAAVTSRLDDWPADRRQQ